MSYCDTLIGLSVQSERQAQAVYQMFTDGTITAEECQAMLATVIAGNNSRAAALADLSLAATLMVQLGRPVAAVGVLPALDDIDRLTKAAATVLTVAAGSPVPEAIVGRLGRSEPLHTAARTYSQAIKTHPDVHGWYRDTGGHCCELCEWLGKRRKVFPATVAMKTHPGCQCVQVPVTRRNN